MAAQHVVEVSAAAHAAAALERAVDAVRALDLDTCRDEEVRGLLAACESAGRRLRAVTTRAAGALTARARSAAAAERPDDRRAPDRAAADVRRGLAGDLGVSPSQAKQLVEDDRRLAQVPGAREAYEAGALTADHLRVLERTLRGVSGDRRAELEARLVEAARRQDPVAFGRTCRAALAELAPEEAMADLDRQHAQRSARVAQRPDGMTHLASTWPGWTGRSCTPPSTRSAAATRPTNTAPPSSAPTTPSWTWSAPPVGPSTTRTPATGCRCSWSSCRRSSCCPPTRSSASAPAPAPRPSPARCRWPS